VIDVLNSYLRALEPGDLEDPSALTRIRSQMLRRVQVVAGLNKVNDLLIMEFVLN
jgi:flagellar FliL protein